MRVYIYNWYVSRSAWDNAVRRVAMNDAKREGATHLFWWYYKTSDLGNRHMTVIEPTEEQLNHMMAVTITGEGELVKL